MSVQFEAWLTKKTSYFAADFPLDSTPRWLRAAEAKNECTAKKFWWNILLLKRRSKVKVLWCHRYCMSHRCITKQASWIKGIGLHEKFRNLTSNKLLAFLVLDVLFATLYLLNGPINKQDSVVWWIMSSTLETEFVGSKPSRHAVFFPLAFFFSFLLVLLHFLLHGSIKLVLFPVQSHFKMQHLPAMEKAVEINFSLWEEISMKKS